MTASAAGSGLRAPAAPNEGERGGDESRDMITAKASGVSGRPRRENLLMDLPHFSILRRAGSSGPERVRRQLRLPVGRSVGLGGQKFLRRDEFVSPMHALSAAA